MGIKETYYKCVVLGFKFGYKPQHTNFGTSWSEKLGANLGTNLGPNFGTNLGTNLGMQEIYCGQTCC